MKFGWINIFGAVIVILMLIPNIIYEEKNRNEKSPCSSRLLNLPEQVGRFACIILMWLPLLVGEFGFNSVLAMIVYLACNGVLLAVYIAFFAVYIRKRDRRLALVLAVLPACIFLLSGILLRHWLLVGFAVLFAAAHICVTLKNMQAESE